MAHVYAKSFRSNYVWQFFRIENKKKIIETNFQKKKSNWRKEVLETFYFILSKLVWKEKLFLIITSGWAELRRSIQSMIEKTIQVFSFQFFPKTKFWFWFFYFWHNCCNLTQLHNFEERKKFQYSFFFSFHFIE